MTYIPQFKCTYCGEYTAAQITGEGQGLFVPCSCKEAREQRDREHYIEMERRKQARRRNK